MKKAIIFGSTGLTGAALLQQLLENSGYQQVNRFLRTPDSLAREKLITIITDFTDLDAHANTFSEADVFCCLGTTIAKVNFDKEAFKQADLYRPMQIAEAAKKFGANQFIIISALGANKNSSIFYNRVKGELEEQLKQLQLPAVHIMHPSLLLGERREKRKGEGIAKVLTTLFRPLMFGPLKKARPILASDVAKAMIRIAEKNNTGYHIYPSDQLQEIADAK